MMLPGSGRLRWVGCSGWPGWPAKGTLEPYRTNSEPYRTTRAFNSPTGSDNVALWLPGSDPDWPSALQLIRQFVVAVTR